MLRAARDYGGQREAVQDKQVLFFFFFFFYYRQMPVRVPRVTNPNETLDSTRIGRLFERQWR